jgi:universal stress protein A
MKQYQHLLLPTDLTDASEPAAERADMIVKLTGAKLTILHIVDYVPPQWVANELPEEFATESALMDRAQAHMSGWMRKFKLEAAGRRIATGSPKKLIVEIAKEIGADLIVMGTHGDRGLARIVGSTARGVLHDAPCDVLVVHMNKPH